MCTLGNLFMYIVSLNRRSEVHVLYDSRSSCPVVNLIWPDCLRPFFLGGHLSCDVTPGPSSFSPNPFPVSGTRSVGVDEGNLPVSRSSSHPGRATRTGVSRDLRSQYAPHTHSTYT